ncbi:MAG: NADH-quinone oxidoreductase subunit M [Pseudomonadota bacterium]
MDNLLSIIIFIPAIAAAILALFLRGDDEEAHRNAKWVAFIATVMTFVVSVFILFEFDAGDPGFQVVEEHEWLFGVTYRVGVDGISLWMVLLTTFLMPLIIAGAWRHEARTKGFMIALLTLETLILGAFLSTDLMFFFIFAEAAIVPLLVVLTLWGGDGGRATAVKLMLYAVPGAVAMLLAMVVMTFDAETTDIEALMTHQFSEGISPLWMALAFLASFAMKLPLWPLHAWSVGVQARVPSAMAMVLAALLTKVGAYGILRFVIPMFPEGAAQLAPVLMWVSVFMILYAGIAALASGDLRRLIGYAGIAHMGLILLGVFSAAAQGVHGAIFMMVSHGLAITALIFVLVVLKQRVKSTDIAAFGGVAARMPFLAFGALIFTMASVGVPATSGFVGVFLSLIGVFEAAPVLAALAFLGLVIVAAALLGVVKRVIFGPLIKQSLKELEDLDRREFLCCAVLLCAILYLGLFPGLITESTAATVDALVLGYRDALE